MLMQFLSVPNDVTDNLKVSSQAIGTSSIPDYLAENGSVRLRYNMQHSP